MSETLMKKLEEKGWFLSENGYEIVSENEKISDYNQIIRRAVNLDLREIGSGNGIPGNGNLVLQIQKIRNVASAKNNEESRSAPRLLKLSLTDGKNSYQAIEVEHIPNLNLKIPPGTKLLLGPGDISTCHGILLLKPSNIAQFLGGRVTNLIEKWEINQKLASHSRVRSMDENGPPQWIPFGEKILKVKDQLSNFKALPEKDKPIKENTDFDAQRQGAIAEAAKQANRKVFGGGNKQMLDHNVQQIVDQGFSVEQAEHSLKISRNNVDRALRNLLKYENRHDREPREPRGKRFEKKLEDSGKPSSGKVSLFDFLENKLPAQLEQVEISNVRPPQTENYDSNRFQARSLNQPQSTRGGRLHKGRGGKNLEEERPGRFSYQMAPNSQFPSNSTINQQQSRPPRFQKNDATQNYYQRSDNYSGNFNNTASQSEYKNAFPQSYMAVSGNNKNYGNGVYSENPVKFQNKSFEMPRGRQNQNSRKDFVPEKSYRGNESEKGLQSSENRYEERQINAMAGAPWVWQKGDKCMAKYWEDNMYYNAEVFGVSEKTCVVQFCDFLNFEEVLHQDLIPVTEEILSTPQHVQDTKQQDFRSNRASQNYVNGMEFRRGNGGKNIHKKKSQQRSAQAIYQPPAQRNVSALNNENAPNFSHL